MMPFGFLAALPWKWIALGIAALAAIGAIVLGAKGALDNARTAGLKQGRAEVQSRWDAEKAGAQRARAELSGVLVEAFNGLDGSLQTLATKINKDGDTILVQAGKEMARDPRYTDTRCELTPGVRSAIDAARGLSRPAATPPISDSSLPASGAIVRFELGPSSER